MGEGWVFHCSPVGVQYISLFFTPEPNFNVWLPTASIPDQAVSVWIMWSCYGDLGAMLIISNYTNRTQRPPEPNSVCELAMGTWCGGKNMTNTDHSEAMKRLLGE